jgi:creatinase
MERPDFFELKNGEKVKLPFTDKEYNDRVSKLRSVMDKNNLDMIILTSMHNVAYYTGFIYCSFGRPYGCVITQDKISTISANIDASQPWRRSHCDNVIYTDWKRDNFLRAIVSIIERTYVDAFQAAEAINHLLYDNNHNINLSLISEYYEQVQRPLS